MLGLFLLFALNKLFSALFSKKTALLLTNQNGEIFSCILLALIQVKDSLPVRDGMIGNLLKTAQSHMKSHTFSFSVSVFL